MIGILGTIWENRKAVAIGLAIAAIPTGYLVGHWRGVSEGRALERTAALKRSMEVIKERSETDAKINSLDDAGLCAALHGRWVPDAGECQ